MSDISDAEVEAAARAVANVVFSRELFDGAPPQLNYDSLSERAKSVWRKEQRAALEAAAAVREPSVPLSAVAEVREFVLRGIDAFAVPAGPVSTIARGALVNVLASFDAAFPQLKEQSE